MLLYFLKTTRNWIWRVYSYCNFSMKFTYILLLTCYSCLTLLFPQDEIEGFSEHDESGTPGRTVFSCHVEVK